MMKKILFAVIAFLCFFSAEAQVKMPAPSPTEYLRQDFGLSNIELTYSRPGLKGRNMIGNVEPWGVVWRTGANAATKIHFHDAVEINGQKIDSGAYALYTIPQKNGEWNFILNKGVTNWGADGYKESDDVLRMKVKAGKNAKKVETLTMQFSDITPETINLNIKWEDFALQIPIVTKIRDRVKASVEEALTGEKKPYWQAANYYYEYEKNYPKALEMVNEAIAQQPKPAYYVVYFKAKVQKEMGDKKGAIATAQQSLELAKAANNEGYILLNQKLINELK